jgi:hypothetical protein
MIHFNQVLKPDCLSTVVHFDIVVFKIGTRMTNLVFKRINWLAGFVSLLSLGLLTQIVNFLLVENSP